MAELRSTRNRRMTEPERHTKQSHSSSGVQENDIVTKKRRKKKPARKSHKGAVGIILLLLVCLFFVAAIGYRKYGPGRTKADFTQIYGCGAEGSVAICDGEALPCTLIERDGRTYLPVECAALADPKWYYGTDGLLLYSIADQTIEFAPGVGTYTMSGVTKDAGYPIWLLSDGTAYLSADFLQSFSGVSMTTFAADAEKNAPARVLLEKENGVVETAKVLLGTSVRYRAGIKSPVVTKTKMLSTVRIIERIGRWAKIRTTDGYIGYVLEATLFKKEVEIRCPAGENLGEYSSISMDQTVCLAFHQIFDASKNGDLETYLADTKGINVLVPTWYSIADTDGNISSMASIDYVNKAHAMGIQVWALIDDFKLELGDDTYLSSRAARTNTINLLLEQIRVFGLDGINVDFEGVKSTNAVHFRQFLRELSIALRNEKKILSVDNYPVSSGRDYYGLEEQGQIADYVIIMSYDEHYKGSDPGTNASLGFTSRAITDTMEEVPASKIINALPFFTRLWWEGNGESSSKAIGMRESLELVEEKGAELKWLDDISQYYASWTEDGVNYQIWLEDEKSLELKLAGVKENEIGGVAFWKLGLEKDTVWDLVKNTIQ